VSDERPDLKRTKRIKNAAIDLSKIEQLPPHSIESEQGVLGCCILDARPACDTISERGFGTEMFYDFRHQEILTAILDLDERKIPVDMITLRQHLKDSGQLDAVGGISYITSLVDATPSSANLPFYIDIVEAKYRLRRTIRACSNIIAAIYQQADEDNDVEALLDEAEKMLAKCNSEQINKPFMDGKEAAMLALASIELASESKGKLQGLSTGFVDLDKITLGLHASEMIVIAARPSVGKTSLAMNIAEHASMDKGVPVGVFTLEMSSESLAQRIICGRARVNIRDIREGFMTERDYPKIGKAAIDMRKAPIWFDDTSGLTIMQMKAKARRMHQQHGIKLLVIDYLQLVKGSAKKYSNRQEEVADVSQGIKSIAKELKIPVIVLAQLNRESEKESRKPRMSDLRESGSIEADADVIGMLYRPSLGKVKDDDEDKQWSDTEPINLLIAKQRNGQAMVEAHFTFIKAFTRFENAAKIESEDRVPHRQHAND